MKSEVKGTATSKRLGNTDLDCAITCILLITEHNGGVHILHDPLFFTMFVPTYSVW